MKERPILFSGPMVRAILEGRKSQTRRVVKGIALDWLRPGMFSPRFVANPDCFMSPYGYLGDRLWVRETWATIPLYDAVRPAQLIPSGVDLFWKADGVQTRYNKTEPGKWRPSIFMPRWASRLTLALTAVRVERLQDMSLDDMVAEGFPDIQDEPSGVPCMFNRARSYWDSLNAKRGYSWDSNPWVWVLTFEVAK